MPLGNIMGMPGSIFARCVLARTVAVVAVEGEMTSSSPTERQKERGAERDEETDRHGRERKREGEGSSFSTQDL